MDYRAMNALTDDVNKVCKSIAFSVSLAIEPIIASLEGLPIDQFFDESYKQL